MINYIIIIIFFITINFIACGEDNQNRIKILKATTTLNNESQNMNYKINKSEEEWKKTLTPEQYRVLRQKATERPHSGKYDLHFEEGLYKCAGCGNVIFNSNTKFDAHCGWPSFTEATAGSVLEIEDRSFGMIRTEIVCANCGGHLGHLFDDGPEPTGLRYCINSISLDFQKSDSSNKK